MGHASYKDLSIVSKHESVLGIPKLSRVSNVACGLVLGMPKLSRVSNVVCGQCQLGK